MDCEIDIEKARERIKEVEIQIKSYFKADGELMTLKKISHVQQIMLDGLLEERCDLLDRMHFPTSDNIVRLDKVDKHLRKMTAKLYERVKAMESKASVICDAL